MAGRVDVGRRLSQQEDDRRHADGDDDHPVHQGREPDDIEGWGNPIGETTVTEERTEIPLKTPGKLRYYLVWITSPAAADDDEGFLVEINEIRLLA